MVTFQILDSYSQDLKVLNETETAKEVEYIRNDDDYEPPKKDIYKLEYIIHLFGTTSDGKSVRVSVNNFQPYFYIELPDSLKSTYNAFLEKFQNTLKNDKFFESIEKEYIKKEKLYGYTRNTKFPFIKLSVNSLAEFRKLKHVFLDDKCNSKFKLDDDILQVYEANLDPMLRFFHIQNIKPCGWVSIDCEYSDIIDIDWRDVNPHNEASIAPYVYGYWDIECYSSNGDFPLAKKDYYKISKQLYEFASNYSDVKRLLTEAIVSPLDSHLDGIYLKCETPLTSVIEKYLSEASFTRQIEELFTKKDTYTKEDFVTVLNKCLKNLKHLPISGDPIIQIGIVFSSGNKLGEKHIFVLDGADDVEGIIIHNCKTEKDMILKFMKLVNEKGTDILVGYNTFGFDMKYLYERMEELMIAGNASFQNLSRIVDISRENPVVLQEKKLASSALGDNVLYLWTTTGRLHIDLYFYIKRIENLASYKLDDVCRYYMSGKLKSIDVSKKDTWFIETRNTSDAEVGKYLVLLDEIGDTIVDKRKILEVGEKGLTIESGGDEILDTVESWAIVKDDVSPAEIFRQHREGGTSGRAIVAKYCIQDCVLVFHLFNKLDVFNNAMAMANTCSVPISYIFTRGQGIKCESLIFKECAKRNQLIEVLTNPINKTDDDYVEEKYEGAIVLVPEPNFYAESPIGVADFASLYPSTIYSENISYDTLLWAKDFDVSGKFIGYSFGGEQAEKYLDPSVSFTDIDFDIWAPDPTDARKNPEKLKTGLRVCRYVQQANDAKGTLPDIVSALLAARKSKRKEAEKESDPFKKALLDAEQLAYKLTANSLYGQLGSATFKVRLQHLAASTTAYGRKQILFAKDAIETFYGKGADPRCDAEIVYGDTDSLFVNFKVRDPDTKELYKGVKAIEATMALTEEAGKFVTRCLKKPHDFEYDKVFYPFIIFSKKRYVGNKYEDSPLYCKQTSMGIATKRRDYAAIVKNVYGGAIKILLNEKNILKAHDFVKKTCTDLVDGKISTHQLTLTKSLRSEYKAVTPPAHKMLADRITLRDPGNAPSSGERIQFMYVLPEVGQQASKLQGDRIETPSFIKENGLKIDYKYYIEHQIFNPIIQLFGLFVDQIPGYVSPRSPMCIEEKEQYAGELLFRDIYAKCDKQNVRGFAQKFGFEVLPLEKKTPSKLQPKAPRKKKGEVFNFQKLDRFLIANHTKELKLKKLSDKTPNECVSSIEC